MVCLSICDCIFKSLIINKFQYTTIDIIYFSSFYSLFTDASNYLKVKFVIEQSKIRYTMYGSI